MIVRISMDDAPTTFAVWADLVVPAATGILTLITAIAAVAIAARANKTAEHAMDLEERLAEDAINRDALARRREVGTAVIRWHEYALVRAIAGKAWNDAVGEERAERWKVLAGEYGDRDFEDFAHSLAGDLLGIANTVGLGNPLPRDALGRLGGVETEVRLWIADPATFAAETSIRERIGKLRAALDKLNSSLSKDTTT